MAWFGDGLSSLSNLKGQITNFTKEVLSEGIVEEIDERTKELNEANERCVQLQEILTSKDAEISMLRRQNGELQKVVLELNARNSSQAEGDRHEEDYSAFFWDPPSIKNQDAKKDNQAKLLRDQLSEASVRIRELEAELINIQMRNGQHSTKDVPENHHRTELLRAKQDTINRIIQMGEKSREAERNMKRLQSDEAVLVNDFRTIISKLGSTEQQELIRAALKSLERENEKDIESGKEGDKCTAAKKFDDEQFESVCLRVDGEAQANRKDEKVDKKSSNKELELQTKIGELEEANSSLNASIVELDEQHAESIEKLLTIKEEMQKKHETLQNAYEQLYAEFNEARSKLETAESRLESAELKLKLEEESKLQLVRESNNRLSEESSRKEESASEIASREDALVVDELAKRVKCILKSESIVLEEDDEETVFEAVARRYVESNWKKEMLERRLTELTRELNQVSDAKESMQMECDDMQLNIESLLSEIQRLKSNLPSIPEASEERVATLETEAETLQEDAERLRKENEALKRVNIELTAALRRFETTQGTGDNAEVESKEVKEQLDTEDSSDRLHSVLEENNELQKRITEMEDSQEKITERLEEMKERNSQLERDANIAMQGQRGAEEMVNDLKSRLEQFEGQLGEELKRRNELQSDLDEVLQQKEQLLAEMGASNESEDLKYDLNNMRKELDGALAQSELLQSQMSELRRDNEKLSKENVSLSEQLSAAQDESLDNIELLNTEMVLLEQKFNALQKEAAEKTSELDRSREQEANLEAQTAATKILLESLQCENRSLLAESEALKGLQMASEEETRSFESEIRAKEEELVAMRERCTNLQEEASEAENRFASLEKKYGELDEQLKHLKMVQGEEVASEERIQLVESEKKQLVAVLEERCRELEGKLQEERRKVEVLTSSAEEASQMSRETIGSLSQLVREKDEELQRLKHEQSTVSEEQLETVKRERDELVGQLRTKHNESVQYYQEIQRLTMVLNEQVTANQKLSSEQEMVSVVAKDKEAELLWAQNELQVLRQKLKKFEESGNQGEVCGVVEHSVQIAHAGILNEKCNALEAALVQEQSSNRMLQNQLTESQSKEAAAAKELERLRCHLVEMEASYTEEALVSEQRQAELEAKLLQAEERVKNSSTVYTSASIRANQQVETLQQQMTLIVQQRDDIQKKLSAAEDKVLSHAASLTNLQIVLEQFQRDKESDIEAATEKIRRQLDESYKKQNELLNEISNLKDQLAEARECLKAASRLSEELDKKTERIEELKREVARLAELVGSADERIQGANKSGEGKVDKTLVKNLVLGYLSSPGTDKSSVLRVLATVLEFDESERNKSGLNNSATGGGWFTTLLGSGGATPSKDQEASLSAAFVRFLESESKPKAQLPALPISTTPPPRPTHSRQHSSSSTQSTLLLSNVALPTFPDFVPARNTGSILKEVLKDS